MEQWPLGGKAERRPAHVRFSKHLPLSMVLPLIGEYLSVFPIGQIMALGMGFCLEWERTPLPTLPPEKPPTRTTRKRTRATRKRKALAEVERLRALLQEKDADPR